MSEDAATVLPFPRPTPAADAEKREIARAVRAVSIEYAAALVDQIGLVVAADNRHAYTRAEVVGLLRATADHVRAIKAAVPEMGGAA